MKFEVFDSTLRDGSQSHGISFSIQDKINIVKILDSFGVDFIEAGNPGSNPKDRLLFEELSSLSLKHSKLCAFGATVKKGDRASLQSLIDANTPVVSVVGKASSLQATEILGIGKDENLEMISYTIGVLKEAGKEVIFDAEHFFDAYTEDAEYAKSVLCAAAYADRLCLCDTNGGSMPFDIKRICEEVIKAFPGKKFAIHCHDDAGCGAANSMAAVLAGAMQVQGTFTGFGERCGNAALCTVIPNLVLKCGYECNADLSSLRTAARAIAEISNIHLLHSAPYVGKNAFSHKGGMHIDAVQKLPSSFEHISPETVGNERKILLSEMSGRGSVLPKILPYIPDAKKDSPETENIINLLKERELHGYSYEGAPASFELLVKRELGLLTPHFKVIMYKVSDDFPAPDGQMQANAIVKVEVGGKTELRCATGNGPVSAVDQALREALSVFYPELDSLKLTDYKVRVINSQSTQSKTRVLIESSDGKNRFTTIGVSDDIIEASVTALVDSFEYSLS